MTLVRDVVQRLVNPVAHLFDVDREREIAALEAVAAL